MKKGPLPVAGEINTVPYIKGFSSQEIHLPGELVLSTISPIYETAVFGESHLYLQQFKIP